MDPLHMDVPVLEDKQYLIYINSVLTWNLIWRNCEGWWMIGTDGERELGKSMLLAQVDDDDNSPTSIRDEMDITTFYNKLSSLVWHIPKHKVLIISGDTSRYYIHFQLWVK